MEETMNFSNSSKDKYNTCAKMYKLHYIDKIRPTTTSSSLVFGGAVDLGLNELLLNTGKDAYETFIKNWTTVEINKVPTYLQTSPDIVYTTKDFDVSLLTQDDYKEISLLIDSGKIENYNFGELAAIKSDKRQGWNALTEEQKKCFNVYNWYSLKNKAKLFIEAYKEEVIPKLKKVVKVQHPINLSNGEDSIVGFIDIVAEVNGYEGNVILDNKTASKAYKDDSVRTSQQLALYTYATEEELNAKYAGYVVMDKDIKKVWTHKCKTCGFESNTTHKSCSALSGKKRCGGELESTYIHKANIQFIVDEIPLQFKEKIIEEFDGLVTTIKHDQNFEPNLNNCRFQFGAPCVYYNLCHSDSIEGLVKNE
jgi:PD-(D/E)XK nuclease superfamily